MLHAWKSAYGALCVAVIQITQQLGRRLVQFFFTDF